MKDQKWVMQGQLEQMKGSSTQTDKLIGETHTLATNAGTQATNAADEVKKLGALVDATNKQASATNGQLSVMQKQLEATDRPWISINVEIATPLTYGPMSDPMPVPAGTIPSFIVGPTASGKVARIGFTFH